MIDIMMYDIFNQAYDSETNRAVDEMMEDCLVPNSMGKYELSDKIKNVFSEICSMQKDDTLDGHYRCGRFALARHLVHLTDINLQWTKQYILPLFDWNISELDAQWAWQGFLMSKHRINIDTIGTIKLIEKPFLDTARHYKRLGSLGEIYINLLNLVALNSDGFDREAIAHTIRRLPTGALLEIVFDIRRRVEGSGQNKLEFWEKHMKPFFRYIWVTHKKYRTLPTSTHLAELCACTGDAFPVALKEIHPWLQPIPSDDLTYIIDTLIQNNICENFPKKALSFLSMLVSDRYIVHDLKGFNSCLRAIVDSKPKLASDERFKRLLIFGMGSGS